MDNSMFTYDTYAYWMWVDTMVVFNGMDEVDATLGWIMAHQLGMF